MGGLAFEEVIRAGKYVRHYTRNLQKLKDKLKELDDCLEINTRDVSEANGRGDEIEVNVRHWQTGADSLKADIEQLIEESFTKASISCIACSCPNIVWRYKFSKQAEEKMVDADARITNCNNFNHQISHPSSHYMENLQKLKDKLRDLGDCREIIRRKVSEDNGRGDEIEVNVLHWQTDASSLLDGNEQLISESTNICSTECPDITRQFKFSKQAEEKIADADGLIIKYNNFNHQISHPRPRPPELESLSDKNYVNFDSRASIFKDVMDALKDSNVNMIGVFGLGGVGKTTLVKEVGEQMRKDGTFKQVAMAVVSKDLNVKEVQSKLADSLNFEFKAKADDHERRATKLWNKFTNGDKYLIILDDIWEKVDLKAIGIPITDGKTGCKVVLTSRNEDLLSSRMEVNRNFSIGELLSAEAWTLFTKKVGNSFESQPELYSLAYKVCRKCKGLPIAVNALGEALKGKQEHAWMTALDMLEKYMLTKIEGIDTSVFASLRVSYDMLHSADAKSCFLLCCLFAEDAEIPIDELMRLCVARNLLDQNPHTLDKARNAVRTVVDTLKSASLLTIGGHETIVKIHDVIRDVGISIAREEEAFLVDHGALRWPRNPTNEPSYKAMSLSFKNIKGLPDGLVYPRIHTLMVDNTNFFHGLEVGDNFFNGMTQLVVLTVTRMHEQQDTSHVSLEELDTSSIDNASLEELDTSSIDNASLEELRELLANAQLTTLHIHVPNVKLLPKEDLKFAGLKGFRISVGLRSFYREELISRRCMLKLEGIQLRNEFIPLVEKAEELVLTPESSVHPLRLFNKLTVLIIEHFKLKYLFSPTTARGFVHLEVLKVTSCEIMEGIIGFEGQKDENEITGEVKFSKLKELKLKSLPNLISFFAKKEEMGTTLGSFSARAQPLFNEQVIFPVLEELTIDGLGSIIKIWDKQSVAVLEGQGSFCQLTSLQVSSCSKLMHVFPSNMHPQLKNLEWLEVKECETMKGIAEFEGEIDEDGLRNEVAASLALEVEHLEMVGVPKITEIRDKQPVLPEPKKEVESLCKLMGICIKNCGQLLYVFPSHMLPQNLQELFIHECDELEVIFSMELKEKEAINNDIIVFPRLKAVTLKTLRKLKSFYTETQGFFFSHKVAFPVLKRLSLLKLGKITRIWDDQPLSEPEKKAKSFSELEDIVVYGCDQLEYVLPSYMLLQLKNLQKLNIYSCTKVEVIISNNPKEKEATNNNDTIRFPQLKILELEDLPNLKSFIRCDDETQLLFSNKVIFPVLEWLNIDGLGSIIKIWDKQSLAVLEDQGSFSQLTNLKVKHCSKLMHVFPSNMHPQLKNLERLEVNECETMKGIAEFEGEIDEDGLRNEVAASLALEVEDKQPLPEPKKEVESLCKLMDIRIENCGQLLYVFPSHMLPQNLQQLFIEECDELEVIFSKELKEKEAINNDIIVFPQLQKVTLWALRKLKSFYTETQGSFFSHKVVFPVLKCMQFWNLDKITRIWDDQPLSEPEKEAKSFLQKIHVGNCNQLEYVLPFYMLPQLKNLQELNIWNCTKVEVIISNNPKEKEKEATNNNDTIRFPQLKTLTLSNLPNLKSFVCSDETQLLFSNKVVFLVLEMLFFANLSKITRIWDNQPLSEPEKEATSFLQEIYVADCNQLEYVLPFCMLPQLKNLQELIICRCGKMEMIISNNPKEKEATNNNDTIRFPQLKTLTLSDLPNLKSFVCSDEMQLFFSNKDAFPVLKLLDLSYDFEFLRNETSTKEECGTSGKESDYNGEELDEDLETPTKENNKMAGTSPAQARKGKDIQGIPWERLNITREKYRQTRLEQYKYNYKIVPQSGEGSEKDCKVTMKGGMYYEFRHNSRSMKSTILHDQMRNSVWATSKHDVYLMSQFSVTHWSALTCNKTEVLNVSGHVAPCEKHSGSLLEGFTRTQVSTLAVKDRLLVAGGYQGELICKNLDRPRVCFCTRTTFDDNASTNVVEIYSTQSGAVHFTAANNDCGVRDFDMEKFQLSKHFCFPWPVNHTSMSPDGKLRIIVGDDPEGMLVDSGTGKMVASLVGHLDFSLASAWHPDGLTFATGNQDKTCRIWDARNLSKSVAALRGNLGAIQSIRYSSDGRFMAMAELADFVHVFDAKSGYEKEQEIDFFGEISGMSFSPDTESLFIGVCIPIYGSLLEFRRRRNNSCPDSII
ncbi:hypothetical protein RHGRI_006318 [Rhododendron griersonianum]|uniref:NB-ARC domain-containing protein n=1 Tax=Rhododendron griersonianum TaxID=479676 RepID=A0AAV6KTR2_9ERIC|nr:hypothetical protein RHGRI_006318 [Rhododendron griersonianum]